ncbi:MAG: metal-dependent transcriptional regulator [Thermoplasmatales archaeon]|nr:metal-dependent transcriptional regulator [Candidatus Thermoplasmatota archaeon]MCL6003500.1 metal-dependent transcriptional regulator [Candidatus Thermoplasmatota archaeon]MDA8054429.1 metal-dependent transcriptional regulator [Thermoplasmatales archaeon]
MESNTNVITRRERDCLVTLEEDSPKNFPMRLHQIAQTLRVKPPTALNVIRRLERKGLAESKDGMVILTESGDKVAKSILLVHRTYESLLCQSGVSENSACSEAAEVDYIIPAGNARLILKKIGSPKLCPHGKPIPEEE